MIGIYYEFDINKNPFKGRQVFHKAIKLNGKSLDFWLEYLRFEAKFVKLVEERQDFLLDKNDSKNDDLHIIEDDFLGFESKKQPKNDDDSDMLEFDDSEEDGHDEKMQEEKIESYGKSTHELIIVIFESIIEAFKENESYKTTTVYEKVLEVLFSERQNSKEMGAALNEIEGLIKNLNSQDNKNLSDIENFDYGLKELELKIDESLTKEISHASVLQCINLLEEYCKSENQKCITFRILNNVLRIAEKAKDVMNENCITKMKKFLKPH